MRYTEATLSKDEKILLNPELHWWNYVRSFFRAIFVFVMLYIFIGLRNEEDKLMSSETFFLISFIVSLIFFLLEIIETKYKFTELVCTNKRVVYKTGLVMRDANELKLGKIESVEVKQSILGRIFGYGDVYFSGTGTSKLAFKRIANPLQIKGQIADILEEYKNNI